MTCVRLVGDSVGSFAALPRPRHRRPQTQWVGLWPRVKYPQAQYGLYLWEDGRVLVVESHDDYELWKDRNDANAIVAGGTVFITDTDDWRYQVLVAAGYLFKPCEGEAPPSSPGLYPPTYQPTY